MDRRELLKMIAVVTGGSVIGGEFLLAGCRNEAAGPGILFTEKEINFLNDVAETILPKTETPGAKDARIGEFMNTMVNDCYSEKDQLIFKEGIKKIDDACNVMHGNHFLESEATQKKELIVSIDKEAADYRKNKTSGEPNHYFTMIKQLTLLGFFTSEPALTQCFNYLKVPGKYEGAAAWEKGIKLNV